MAEHTSVAADTKESGETNRKWWRLPFDDTTNFSLLGYILGGLHWEGNEEKKVDLTLNEK